jgi:hypothetical protein
MTTYSIKNVKTMQGRDGTAFSCTIYCDGAKVGYARNDGNGGSTSIDMLGEDYLSRRAAEEALGQWTALNCAGTWVAEFIDENPLHNAEMGIDMLFDQHEQAKALKRHAKTKVLFRLPEDPEDQFRTVTHRGDIPATVAWVRAKYPTATIWDADEGRWAA